MKYYNCDCKSYKIYGIKTEKYKTSRIDVIFRREVTKENLTYFSFLLEMLTFSTKKYPKKQDLVRQMEELYLPWVNCHVKKLGKTLLATISIEFINQKYIKEENYLEEIIKILFEIILNPLVINDEFKSNSFNIVKNKLIQEFMMQRENNSGISIRNALLNSFESETAYMTLDSLETINSVTPSNLYNTYQELLNSVCDIFALGDLEMEKLFSLIQKHYKNNIINISVPELFVKNSLVNKPKHFEAESNFIQSSLVVIYNLDNLSELERDIYFYIFNYIFSDSSLNSKVLTKIRTNNSLCYGLRSNYLKHDNLLIIQILLKYENVELAKKLIDEALTEMKKGIFTEEEFSSAKKGIISFLKTSYDNNYSTMNNYQLKIFFGLRDVDERIKIINDLKKEQIIEIAKKVKLNTIYIQKENKNERN